MLTLCEPWSRAIQTVTLTIHRFSGLAHRLWVIGQMGAAHLAFRAMPDCGFYKLCGSGTGEGFTPRPNWGVWVILAAWPDLATAQARVGDAAVYRRWARRADEVYTLFLTPTSARGTWSGKTPFQAETVPVSGPIAALTRATVKPATMMKFWGRVPDISTAIGMDKNVAFKIGIGDVPLLRQVTFSVWPDTESMAHFARADGPHAQAIKAVRAGDWFAEELYARFAVSATRGTWGGHDPLARFESLAA